MSLNYAHEKLFGAVSEMARSTNSLQERLANVFTSFFLSSVSLREGLSEDMKMRLDALYERMTDQAAVIPDEGTIAATIRVMSDSEADRIIRQIVSLYDEVTQMHGQQFPSTSK